MNITWNAQDYTDDFSYVQHYGQDVLSLLTITPGMRVVDLGCGNGALTQALADRGADVVGIDASTEMLTIARREHPALPFIQADAAGFALAEPVDGIFSNAVFHWISDQDTLLANVARALKPGGQLVCEFGGKGNVETIHRGLEQAFQWRGYDYPRVFYFPTIGEYASLLERHGLRVVYAALFDRITDLNGPDGVADWIRMFAQEPLALLAPEQVDEVVGEAAANTRDKLYWAGRWHADYVRIRLKAIKQAAPWK